MMPASDSQHDTAPAEPWWERFFDETYADYGLALDGGDVDVIVAFLREELGLTPGSRVLDQCCGIGRLALPLASQGVSVVGVDVTDAYIRRAREAGARDGVASATFYRADAAQFTAPEPCDGAFNWFTSVGYCEDDEANVLLLRRAFESLRSGGKFALDYMNVPRVLANFRERSFEPRRSESDVLVLTENSANFLTGMIESRWTFVFPDGRRDQRRVSTRMYMPHELVGLLASCGFVGMALYGSVEREAFTAESGRCIVVATKA